ncbi:MAG: glycosyltransferase family 39 protein [bacterium]
MISGEEKLSTKVTTTVLVLLLLSAVYLRFYHLGNPSFWVDEMNHVYAGMSLSKDEAPRFPSGVANERALIYSKMVGWSFSLFGVSESSARLPSAVFGILSILLIYWVGQDLFDRRVGLLAAFFLTFAHPAIGWSRTCRMYTLFQFLFLLGVYSFYKGFEAERRHKLGEKKAWLQRLDVYLNAQGVRWPWLLLSALVFVVSLKVHQLTGLFAATLLVYWMLGFLGRLFEEGPAKSLSSKYFLCLVLTTVAIVVALLAFNLTAFIKYALNFHPNWARYARAEDSHYYYWYLTSSDQFPLAALFLIGAIQALARLNKTALFFTVAFVVPVAFHSFVFSYKIANYIFNVYPFFVLIIAYGLINIYTSETLRGAEILKKIRLSGKAMSPRRLKLVVAALFLLWIPLTVWFRIAVKLPRIDSAGTNGVVTHYDWRGAANFVAHNRSPDDVVLATLPLTVLYYLGNVDFNLNQAHLDESLKWETVATNGRHHEFYTGVPSVESVSDLQKIMAASPNGWVIADKYRLHRTQYVSHELAQFIQTRLKKVWSDKKNTLVVFGWSS